MKEVLSVHDIIDSDNYISPKFRSDDNIKIKSNDDYYQFYKKSIENIGDYWAGVASELYWFKKWDINMHGDFPDFKFFLNGYSNVCFNCIDRHALKNPDKTAIIWLSEDGLERKMDYRSLMIYTSKFASYLRSIGIKKGDVVAIFMPNRIESFIAVHACYRIGAIYNIIFSGFSTKALLDRLYETMPKVIITADKTVRRGKVINIKEKLDSIINNVKSIQKVIIVKRFVDTSLNKNEVSFEDVLKETNDLIDPVHIEANEPGFVIYTSGTTSRPKGIVHSGIGFMVGAYHNVKYALDLNKSDVYWCTADIGWLTFPIFELVGGLAHGATVVAYEGALDFPGIDNFYNTLEKYKINKLFTAPTFLRMLARYGNETASKYNIKLDLISLVGEPLDTKTWYWAHDTFGADINNTYGQTETGSAWTSSIVGATYMRPGSAGLPLPGHAFKIIDDTGKEVKTGEAGTLVITKPFPSLARSIWNDHNKYINQYFSVFPNFYCTYDSAIKDKFGHIWVIGRTDDVINVSGHRISTMEMENSIMSVPDISEAAVIGIDHEIKGTVPYVFFTSKNTDNEIKNKISSAIESSIGRFAMPEKIIMIPEMPKTRSGKIMRRLLKEIVMHGDVSGDITGLENPDSINIIKNAINNQK